MKIVFRKLENVFKCNLNFPQNQEYTLRNTPLYKLGNRIGKEKIEKRKKKIVIYKDKDIGFEGTVCCWIFTDT